MQERSSPEPEAPESDGDPRLTPTDPTFVEFAGRLGHDLNNLLSTVIGSLGLLAEGGSNAADDDSRQLIEDALSASRECADLVDRLMAAAGKQMLRPQSVTANEIVARLAPLLEQTLPDNVELDLSLEPDLPAIVVDPDRLEAAIIDLVVNAREAMPSGGTLVIRTACDDAETPPPGLERPCVRIVVRDAGSGIPEELRGRILEPLFSTKSSGTGRGLGLSTVNGFVRQSGGGMSISSEPGRGTEVTLFFPRAA